jgi:hypothetical protein
LYPSLWCQLLPLSGQQPYHHFCRPLSWAPSYMTLSSSSKTCVFSCCVTIWSGCPLITSNSNYPKVNFWSKLPSILYYGLNSCWAPQPETFELSWTLFCFPFSSIQFDTVWRQFAFKLQTSFSSL